MNISGIIILLGCATICAYAIQRFISRRKAVHRFRRSMGNMGNFDSFQPRGKVDRQTQNKLTRLLGGNQKTINRLLEQSRFKNSDRPEQWHWEKVLYDLERDRWR
jgi:hypothetical protein